MSPAILETNYVQDRRRAAVTPIYDTKALTAGALGSKLIFFDAPRSSTKGPELTNMMKAYELAFPQKFTMKSLRVVFCNFSGIADVQGLLVNYTLQFIRGTVVELEAPIEYWNGGAGISGFAATTATTTTIQATSNGLADPNAIVKLEPFPIVIEAGDRFEVNLVGTSYTMVGTGSLRIYLDGWYEKGVQ